MDLYRLVIYREDGRLLGQPPWVIHAASDAEAVAQPEATRGPLDAELVDVEGLRIVKYLPGTTQRDLRLPSRFYSSRWVAIRAKESPALRAAGRDLLRGRAMMVPSCLSRDDLGRRFKQAMAQCFCGRISSSGSLVMPAASSRLILGHDMEIRRGASARWPISK